MSNLSSLSPAQLRQAADLQDKIQSLSKQLASLLGGSMTATKSTAQKKRRKMSAGTKAKMAAAQKARWAKIKKAKTSAAKAQAPKAPAKKKGGLTPEGKAKLAAAMKARWAAAKAGTGPAPTAGKKK